MSRNASTVTGEIPRGGNLAAASRPTVAMRLVVCYQRLFEGRPSPCRFTPSCSAYALDALESHGTARGLLLTLRRLIRCRPFGPSGWDPVPEPESHTESHQFELHSVDTCADTSEKGC